MSLQNLRSRFTAPKKGTDHGSPETATDPAPQPSFSDQFYDVDTDMKSVGHSGKQQVQPTGFHEDSISMSSFKDVEEKEVFEEQLNHLQEQLVSIMIENQTLAQELKQYKDVGAVDKVQAELEKEKQKRKQLEQELKEKNKRLKRRELNKRDSNKTSTVPDSSEEFEIVEDADVGEPVILEAETVSMTKSRYDRLWDRIIRVIYDTFDDFTEIPPQESQPEIVEPLNLKILKENIKRFKAAAQPYYDTAKGLHNLFTWKSRSYTFIVFCIYMYSVWRGWLIPVLFFLAALRIFVNFLHFKNFQFNFAYLDPGEPIQDEDKDLGLSDKFNLVIQVATKVQLNNEKILGIKNLESDIFSRGATRVLGRVLKNGLGSAADSLEKIKSLLTWRHYKGTKRLFTILCCGFILSAIFPAAYMWKFVGIGFGVKIFITNYLYNKYPRLKKKYDSSHRLWLDLPTDVQYKKQRAKEEVDKYIVPNQRQSEGECDSFLESSDEEEANNFRELFSLPVEEIPLPGWLNGKRTVLFGKERSLITLLSRKRGKLYLTKSFLCFVRDKVASKRNIVIPLQDIVSLQKVKPLLKLPGKGMAIQVHVKHDGKENVLVFGGIIGRDEVVKSITSAVELAKVRLQPESSKSQRALSHRKSAESFSRIQNFTFAAYYDDSE